MGSDSTLLFSLHPTPGIGGRKPYPPGQSPGARGTSLALQESSVKCTELQEENWQFWKEQDQLQQEAALQELRRLLTTKREALKQEQEAKALAAQENEAAAGGTQDTDLAVV
ncbi:hypothetical protein MDA_GLEAN10001017 [Myotis davidii]|uniref:Uncharacterized protein n=1 Tax=Myotis davidii TaxID=225400 RepID=L5M1W8_MYODS|nr:hypothetical protein MDA_GLEAN10001017 [Myotis davidii]